MVVEFMKKIESIADLTPDRKNPRQHNPRNVGLIQDALHEVGAARSIVVDEEGNILAGNATVEAAGLAGIERVRVVEADGNELVAVRRTGLTVEQKRKLSYFDNRTAELATWDTGQIVADLDSGLDLSGLFYDNELVDLLKDADFGIEPKEPPEPQIDRAEELREKWQTARDQIWEIPSKTMVGKSHRVMCGDSTSEEDVGRLMDRERADIAISSPPYWNQRNYSYWNEFDSYMAAMVNIWHILREVLRNGGILFWNIGDDSPNHRHISAHHSVAIEASGFIYIDSLVWKKPGVTGIRLAHQSQHRYYYPGFSFEPLLVFQNPGGAFPQFDMLDGARVPVSNVWEIRVEGTMGGEHPAPFPPELPMTALRCYSCMGNMALDLFLGSGTTMVAGEQTGRMCYGMDISEAYVAVCLQRMADMGLEPRLI